LEGGELLSKELPHRDYLEGQTIVRGKTSETKKQFHSKLCDVFLIAGRHWEEGTTIRDFHRQEKRTKKVAKTVWIL